ncbi:MFS transporter [Glaciibacter sp. 2TAF33]|uniref:MFS transporter n=1 Tax=Glaciibacter sp. 2TAF33 TaxID=3233015 RepID=UPI003F917594
MNRQSLAMAALLCASFMDVMDTMITNVALPSIQADLGASPVELEWTIAGYMIAFATTLLLGGRLGDRFDRRNLFALSLLGFVLASLGATLAWSGASLVGFRIIQGAMAGLMIPQVLTYVQVFYPPEKRAPLYAAIGSMSVLGTVVGQLLGGWLVTVDAFGIGWRSIFLINVPVGLIALAVAFICLPRTVSGHRDRLDVAGAVLSGGAIFLFVFALTTGHQNRWAWWIWVLMGVAVVLLGAFVSLERRLTRSGGASLVSTELFRVRSFSASALVQLLFAFGSGSYAMVLGFYLQQTVGLSPLAFGLILLPVSLGAMAGSAIAVPLSKRHGAGLVVAGGLVQSAAFMWVRLVLETRWPLNSWALVPPMALAGVGLIFVAMPLVDIALRGVAPDLAGTASGVLNTVQQTGSALGIAAAGGLYFALEESSGSLVAELGALWVPVACFVLTAVAAFVSLGLVGRHLPRSGQGTFGSESNAFPSDHGAEATAHLEVMREFR